jgi:hypothetical protein
MKRKQFIKIVDTLIERLEKGEELYSCNEIDTMCLGSLSIQSGMRTAYEKVMGQYGYIPVGFISNEEFQTLDLHTYSALNKERRARRITALALFKEWILRSGEYRGFDYEE